MAGIYFVATRSLGEQAAVEQPIFVFGQGFVGRRGAGEGLAFIGSYDQGRSKPAAGGDGRGG